MEPPGFTVDDNAAQRSSIKMALALVLGALGLMLVGFALVALAMRLLQ
jgi:hypothetical protein